MRFLRAAVGAAAAAVLVLVGIAPAAAMGAQAGDDPARDCEALVSLDLGANTAVSDAGIRQGADGEGDICRVVLTTTHPPAGDAVTSWVHLPVDGWNGRFLGIGGGGFTAGSEDRMADRVKEGFAAASTDAGNPSGTATTIGLNPDGTLNRAGQENYGHRSIHEMTVDGKAVTAAFYGQEADGSYFEGCSTGGRQGAMEAQRYPEDYDGIVAGAPVLNYPRLQVAQLWSQVVMLEEDRVLSPCILDAAREAVVAECDALGDGVVDGVIGDPLACAFDYGSLVGQETDCGETITEEDAAVLTAIAQGPRGADGRFLWYGLAPGATYELTGSAVVDGERVGAPFAYPVDVIASWLEQNPDWDWRTSTYETFEAHMQQAVAMYDGVQGASDPDIGEFAQAGGKLLLWHGWGDFGAYAQGSVDYYERVRDAIGNGTTQQSVRLFMAPGVGHCRGGDGGQPTGQLDALIRWVEDGKAPRTIDSAEESDGRTVATRPICAYPFVAAYKGSGDQADASRYRCVPGERLAPLS